MQMAHVLRKKRVLILRWMTQRKDLLIIRNTEPREDYLHGEESHIERHCFFAANNDNKEERQCDLELAMKAHYCMLLLRMQKNLISK